MRSFTPGRSLLTGNYTQFVEHLLSPLLCSTPVGTTPQQSWPFFSLKKHIFKILFLNHSFYKKNIFFSISLQKTTLFVYKVL
jgi:hypothetical protein